MMEFVKFNTPYIKAGAVVGLTGAMKAMYMAVTAFAGRELSLFPTREKALEWLLTR
jgi:hypothetical protein